MEIFGFAITLLSIVIAYLAWNNGKLMRQAIAKMDERMLHLDERIAKMDERAELRHQEVVKLLERMDERTAKIAELIERIPEKTARIVSNMSQKS